MEPLESLITTFSEPPSAIAITATARGDRLSLVANHFKSAFPTASLYFIAQDGQSARMAQILPGVGVIEALPSGMFGIGKLVQTRFDIIKELAPDLMIVVYNNPTGGGYFALDAETFKEFTAMLDSPPAANPRLRRLLAEKAPWDR